MMPPLREPLAESLLELTRSLKRSIQAGDVEQMELLQSQRIEIMKALFVEVGQDSGEDGRWVSLVRQVQALNQELIGLAKQARDATGRELAGLRRMRKAESSYVQIFDGAS